MGKIHARFLAIYKVKAFARFARKARIPDADIWRAAQQAENGLIDADLGGGVIKQRLARTGQGKSGGSRSIVLFKREVAPSSFMGLRRKTLRISALGS